eukprot:4448369-Amphidinium_carterae.1
MKKHREEHDRSSNVQKRQREFVRLPHLSAGLKLDLLLLQHDALVHSNEPYLVLEQFPLDLRKKMMKQPVVDNSF